MAATPPDLSGKTALVTGASRGFGREIAVHLSRAGANVIAVGREVEALQETRRLALKATDDLRRIVEIRAIDIRNIDSLKGILEHPDNLLPAPDILVNGAAIQGQIGPFAKTWLFDWCDVFGVNLIAAGVLSQLVLPAMQERGWGKIINISGGGATSPRPNFSAYAASKTALVRFSETLAEELHHTGIDVNCVSPGAMNTAMTAQVIAAGPDASDEYERAVKQQQEGGTSPAIGAELVTFLASPASDGITGRLISAVWDPWRDLASRRDELAKTDIYTLRRITPSDRGLDW